MFAITAFYYSSLPQKIPIHFNFKGEADNYSAKSTIWVLPTFGLALVLMLRFVFQTLPKKIKQKDSQKAPKYFTLAFYLFILVLFNYLIFASIQVVLDNWERLGSWFIFSVIIIFNVVGLFMTYRQRYSERIK